MNSLVHRRKCKSNCQRPQQGFCDAVGLDNEKEKGSTRRGSSQRNLTRQQKVGPGALSLRCQCSWRMAVSMGLNVQCFLKRKAMPKSQFQPNRAKCPAALRFFQGSLQILRIHGLGVALQTRGPFLSGNASGRTTWAFTGGLAFGAPEPAVAPTARR